MLSGNTRQVFPSTYYVRDWCERLGEAGEGPASSAPVPARSRVSNRRRSEKNDASISISLFLIACKVLHLSTCLLAICFPPSGNCLSPSFAHFSY